MKNVLQIIASRGWGGGETYLYDLSRKLIERGCKIHIISPENNSAFDRFNKIAPTIQINLKSLFSIFKLAKFIDNQDIDVVHAHIFRHAITACLAAKLTKKPVKVVMTRHLIKKAKNLLIYRWLYRNVDHIIFVSEIAKNEFQSSFSKNAIQPRMSVVYNAIYNTSPLPPKTSENDIINIGYIGRLSSEKGLDTLLAAFALSQHPDSRLTIVGTGTSQYVNLLNNLADERGVSSRVCFTGFCEDPRFLMNSFDIGIAPSKWREPFGLVLLEYMSNGIPVITTNNGAQSEIIVSPDQGILIPPDDPRELAKAIDKLRDEPLLRQILSENGRKRAAEFDYDKFVDQVIKIYNEPPKRNALG